MYGLRKPPTTPFYRRGERDPEVNIPAHMKQPWNCRARIRASLFNHFVPCSQSGTPVSGHWAWGSEKPTNWLLNAGANLIGRWYPAPQSCWQASLDFVNEGQGREMLQWLPWSSYFFPVAKSAYSSIHHLPLCCVDNPPCLRICAVIMSLFIIGFISPISKCVHNIPSGNLLNCHINVILCKLNIYLSTEGVEGKERINNLQSWRGEAVPVSVHNSSSDL